MPRKSGKMIGIESPEGVYRYVNSGWVPENNPDFSQGIHVIYFDNKNCIACRIYDIEWFPLVENMKSLDINFWIVLCTWFSTKCESKIAKELFNKYEIHASPTTLIIVNGKEKRRIEGVVKALKLRKIIEDILK